MKRCDEVETSKDRGKVEEVKVVKQTPQDHRAPQTTPLQKTDPMTYSNTYQKSIPSEVYNKTFHTKK